MKVKIVNESEVSKNAKCVDTCHIAVSPSSSTIDKKILTTALQSIYSGDATQAVQLSDVGAVVTFALFN